MLVWIATAALPLRNDGSLDDTSSAQERQRPRWHLILTRLPIFRPQDSLALAAQHSGFFP